MDLSEYKAERLDAEVLKAAAHFFHTFYDEKNDSFLVEPILIADCYYPDKDDARTKTVLNKIATGAAHAQSDDQYFKDIDEHYTAVRALSTASGGTRTRSSSGCAATRWRLPRVPKPVTRPSGTTCPATT